MPVDGGQGFVPLNEVQQEQNNEEEIILDDYLDSSDDEEDEEEDDELDQELENAYQCDFTKRSPPPCTNTSLLSSLLSCSTTTTVKQSATKKDHSAAITIAPKKTSTLSTADPLSESLKRNLAWEHSQSSLRKYEIIKRSNSSESLTDNFSRY